MTRELYVYTTPIYKNEGLIKVGETEVGQSMQRIDKQFSTSNPEKPIDKECI